MIKIYPTFLCNSFRVNARSFLLHTGLLVMAVSPIATAQDTIAPPEIGQETKGVPADLSEERNKGTEAAKAEAITDEELTPTTNKSFLGSAKITESKRESGQIYLIELEHSSGSKQYIEETDSDGKIESTSNDIEETPNLPKWKLGSW